MKKTEKLKVAKPDLKSVKAISINSPRIQDQALLVRVRIKRWSNAVTDKNLTSVVETDQRVTRKRLIRVRKTLLGAPAVKALSKLAGNIRNNVVGKLTIPWNEDGVRLIPVKLLEQFEQELATAIDKWEELLVELGNDYEGAIEDARNDLADAFDIDDYPSKDDILSRYSIHLEEASLPVAGDLRVSLPQEKLDALREQVETQLQSRIEDAMQSLHERLTDTLKHLIDRLDAFGVDAKSGKSVGVFRDSTVKNLNELIELLPLMNIAGDARIATSTDELHAQLRNLNPEALRQNEGHRQDVSKKAKSIMAKMAGFYDLSTAIDKWEGPEKDAS